MFVYKIINLVNGKAYIGMTKETVNRRWYRHTHKQKGDRCYALHAAIAKYGEGNFDVAQLYEASSYEELQAVEKGLIAQYGTMAPNGYNLTAGGDGAVGYKHSPEKRAIMSKNRKGKNMNNSNAVGHVGSKHKAKLTDAQARRVKMFHMTGMASREIGKLFGIDKASVLNISHGKTYKHIHLEIV